VNINPVGILAAKAGIVGPMIYNFMKDDDDGKCDWKEVDSRADWIANGGDINDNESGYKSYYDHGRRNIVNDIGSTAG